MYQLLADVWFHNQRNCIEQNSYTCNVFMQEGVEILPLLLDLGDGCRWRSTCPHCLCHSGVDSGQESEHSILDHPRIRCQLPDHHPGVGDPELWQHHLPALCFWSGFRSKAKLYCFDIPSWIRNIHDRVASSNFYPAHSKKFCFC